MRSIAIFCLLLGIHVISGDDCFAVDGPKYSADGSNTVELSFNFNKTCVGDNNNIFSVTVSVQQDKPPPRTLCQIFHSNAGFCIPETNDKCTCNTNTQTYTVKHVLPDWPDKEYWLLSVSLRNKINNNNTVKEHRVFINTTGNTTTDSNKGSNTTSSQDGDSFFDQLDTTHLVFIAVGVSVLAIGVVTAMACIMCHTKRNFFLRWRPADNVVKAARNSVDHRGTPDQHQATPETSRATPPPSAAMGEKNQRGGGSSGTLPLTNYCDVQDSMSAANAASLARRPPAAVPKFAAPDLSGDGSAYDEVNYAQVTKPPKARGPVKAPKPTPLDTAAADLVPHETYDHLNAYQQRFRKEKRSPAFGKVKVMFTSNPLSNQP